MESCFRHGLIGQHDAVSQMNFGFDKDSGAHSTDAVVQDPVLLVTAGLFSNSVIEVLCLVIQECLGLHRALCDV